MKVTYLPTHVEQFHAPGCRIPMREVEEGEFFHVHPARLFYTRVRGMIWCFREYGSAYPSGFGSGQIDVLVEIVDRPSNVPAI